jgi:alkylation response protein AidB-like acyl-CoA dehydrogenase
MAPIRCESYVCVIALAVIKANADGLARGEILEKMGLKGDKSGEMSVSNALTALTKNGQVVRGDDRKYRPGA